MKLLMRDGWTGDKSSCDGSGIHALYLFSYRAAGTVHSCQLSLCKELDAASVLAGDSLFTSIGKWTLLEDQSNQLLGVRASASGPDIETPSNQPFQTVGSGARASAGRSRTPCVGQRVPGERSSRNPNLSVREERYDQIRRTTRSQPLGGQSLKVCANT